MFTEDEIRTIHSVFYSLVKRFTWEELNYFIPSITIDEMLTLEQKLEYRDYCNKYNIKFENMTEDDFITACEEKYLY